MIQKFLLGIILLFGTQVLVAAPSLETDRLLVPAQRIFSFIDTSRIADSKRPQSLEVTETAVFPDTARIILIGQGGQELDIGEVIFSPISEKATSVSVVMNHEIFVDQFLSMRPFRCLTDPAEWFCYLPYPYELKQTITTENLTDLEYQLLFIWKSPKDFGIDAWNGVYYKLEPGENGVLTGRLLQGDLNVLANPPEAYSYPIDLNEFISEGSKNRLYPTLVIRP